MSLLGNSGAVLLDFDGPVTFLFAPGGSGVLAHELREQLRAGAVEPGGTAASTADPLEILRWAASTAPDTLDSLDATCRAGELRAAQTATPTAGAIELIQDLDHSARPRAIVSNNAAEAITSFLNRFGLATSMPTVIGRPRNRPDLMKPHPYTLQTALNELRAEPGAAWFIGDSVTDVQVAQTCGVRSAGFGKNEKRYAELTDAGATLVFRQMTDLLLY